jgi:hypothetical protein
MRGGRATVVRARLSLLVRAACSASTPTCRPLARRGSLQPPSLESRIPVGAPPGGPLQLHTGQRSRDQLRTTTPVGSLWLRAPSAPAGAPRSPLVCCCFHGDSPAPTGSTVESRQSAARPRASPAARGELRRPPCEPPLPFLLGPCTSPLCSTPWAAGQPSPSPPSLPSHDVHFVASVLFLAMLRQCCFHVAVPEVLMLRC